MKKLKSKTFEVGLNEDLIVESLHIIPTGSVYKVPHVFKIDEEAIKEGGAVETQAFLILVKYYLSYLFYEKELNAKDEEYYESLLDYLYTKMQKGSPSSRAVENLLIFGFHTLSVVDFDDEVFYIVE